LADASLLGDLELQEDHEVGGHERNVGRDELPVDVRIPVQVHDRRVLVDSHQQHLHLLLGGGVHGGQVDVEQLRLEVESNLPRGVVSLVANDIEQAHAVEYNDKETNLESIFKNFVVV